MKRSVAFAPVTFLCAAILMAPGAALVGGAASAQSAPQAGVRSDGNGVPGRLGALFGQEQAALGAMAPGHVERILGAGTAPAVPASARSIDEEGLTCLAQALYHEARGEGASGMTAVAEVVLNRVESPRFPDSICDVVRQGANNPAGCQFSFVCDGSMQARLEPRAWSRARSLAREMAAGAPRELTEGATHFHATRVRPAWSRVYRMTAEIGAHRFYRRPATLAAN